MNKYLDYTLLTIAYLLGWLLIMIVGIRAFFVENYNASKAHFREYRRDLNIIKYEKYL